MFLIIINMPAENEKLNFDGTKLGGNTWAYISQLIETRITTSYTCDQVYRNRSYLHIQFYNIEDT